MMTGKARTRGLALAFGIVLGLAGTARAQEGPATPTKEHEVLKQDVGTWDATIKVWMAGPDAEPAESKGTETVTLFGDGLWALGKFEGEFGGMKFEGHSQLGYNAKKGKYVGTWIDSMSDRITPMEGTYDAKTRTLTVVVDAINPATGEPMKETHVHKYLDDGSREFTMYVPGPDGKDMKMMEVRYTKKK
jgi:hypothetical protein